MDSIEEAYKSPPCNNDLLVNEYTVSFKQFLFQILVFNLYLLAICIFILCFPITGLLGLATDVYSYKKKPNFNNLTILIADSFIVPTLTVMWFYSVFSIFSHK